MEGLGHTAQGTAKPMCILPTFKLAQVLSLEPERAASAFYVLLIVPEVPMAPKIVRIVLKVPAANFHKAVLVAIQALA